MLKNAIFTFPAAALMTFAAAALVASCATTGANAATDSAAEAEPAEYNWTQVASALEGGGVLCDARSAEGYEKGHIETAINTPARSGDEIASSLPTDKNTQLVFYCGGPQCSASTKAAKVAMKLGYKNVAEYKGGYPEWKELNGK